MAERRGVIRCTVPWRNGEFTTCVSCPTNDTVLSVAERRRRVTLPDRCRPGHCSRERRLCEACESSECCLLGDTFERAVDAMF
jgi:hypothetical protein